MSLNLAIVTNEHTFRYSTNEDVTPQDISVGYNWATLFLRDINMGIWPSMLGQSKIRDSKILSWVLWDSDPRMSALARPSSCKLWTHPLVRECIPHLSTCNLLTLIQIWSRKPDGCLTPWQTGRLTVGRNITLTLTLTWLYLTISQRLEPDSFLIQVYTIIAVPFYCNKKFKHTDWNNTT
jgi:hypothetical protein